MATDTVREGLTQGNISAVADLQFLSAPELQTVFPELLLYSCRFWPKGSYISCLDTLHRIPETWLHTHLADTVLSLVATEDLTTEQILTLLNISRILNVTESYRVARGLSHSERDAARQASLKFMVDLEGFESLH